MTKSLLEGTRVRDILRPSMTGVIKKNVSSSLSLIRLSWDLTPDVISWCKKDLLEIIDSRIGYYLASVVIKVDLNKEHWKTRDNIDFGIQTMLCRNGRDGISNIDDMGVTIVGYKPILPDNFNKLKYAFFVNPGDF